jgi:hypothetical protein
MAPWIQPNSTTLALPSPPSNVQLIGCNTPCSEAIVFDGDNPDNGVTNLGLLGITLYDGFETVVPANKIDPNIADWTGPFVNGSGYQTAPPTVPNTDPLIVTLSTPPATAVSPVAINLGAFGNNSTGMTQHVSIEADQGCSTTFFTTLNSTYSISNTTPYVCYDNAAPFNGDAAQYYSVVSAIGGAPIVPCGGSNPTCPPILTQLNYVPMFVNIDASPSTDCAISGYAGCIQVAQYGMSQTAVVTALIAPGPESTSPAGCDSGLILQPLTFTGSAYVPSGSPTSFGSGIVSPDGGSGSSAVDANGYAEFGVATSASGQCTVSFQYYIDGYSIGPVISRTFSFTGGGTGTGTISTVFGRARRPASRR